MRSYLLTDGVDTVLIDPLAAADQPELLEALDALVGPAVRILVTTPRHVRGSELLWRRWRERRTVHILGHPKVAEKLEDAAAFDPLTPGEYDDGVRVHRLGRPARPEQAIELGPYRALAFGDSVVEEDGELRIWPRLRPAALARGSYEQRFRPTLEPLAELAVDRILVTHGDPVLREGAAELRRALERPIWKRAELY
jgi:hypothetical protein